MPRSPTEQEPLMSNGRMVKQDGKVLHELAINLKKPSNVSCRVEKFGNVVEGFCGVKRRWVAEMGFEGLLHLVGCRLPRSLCYWLATCMDCSKNELVVEGVKFPLSKAQVFWVYGLPYGPKAVPNVVKGKRMKALEKELWDYFTPSASPGSVAVTGKAIIDALDLPAEDEKLFKRAFLMFALNELICPTTCHRLSMKLIPAVLVFASARKYDWCSLLLDHLLFYVARFAKTFDRQGFVAGCGGCTHFLAIMYLDRLNRTPLCWGAYPRVKVWSNREVNKAISEDKVPNGDFGRLGCIDVAYGVAHPSQAKDLFPQPFGGQSAGGNEDFVAHRYYTCRTPKYKRKKRNKTTAGNPYLRKLNKRRREAGEGGGRDENDKGNFIGDSESGPKTPMHGAMSSSVYEERQTEPLSPFAAPSDQPYHARDYDFLNEQMIHSPARPPPLDTDVGVLDAMDSPAPKDVDRVVEGLFSYCSDEGPDVAINPPYTWGASAGQGAKYTDSPTASSASLPGISYSSYDDSDVEADSYIVVPLTPPPGFETPKRTNIGNIEVSIGLRRSPSADESSAVLLDNSPCSVQKSLQKSRKQRVVRSSVKLSSDYIEIWRPSSYRGLKLKLAKVILNSLSDPLYDPVVLQCGGCSAVLSSAAAIVSPAGRVDVQYVAAVSKINTSVWAEKSRGRSKKLMFTPAFALHALAVDDDFLRTVSFCEQHAQELSTCQFHNINAIFVPIREGHQWWAMALSFNREETRILDPCGQSGEHIRQTVTKLQRAIEGLLRHVFPAWNVPNLSSWKVVIPEYSTNCDIIESGVAMLLSVKRCEDRFKATMPGSLGYRERAWLLCEDLMNKHNLARATVQQMIRS